MNFKQMEAFYWLTQLESYRLVAERLSLTQPAISARIAALESEMNLQLIDRSAGGFRLTDEGQNVAEYAEAFMNLHEAMTGKIEAVRHRHFAVGMVGTGPLTWGIEFRSMVAAADPAITLDFHSGSNGELRRLLRSGLLDIAFLADEKGVEHLPNSFAVQFKVGWVASPEMARGVRQPVPTDSMRRQPIVLFPSSSPLSQAGGELLKEGDVRPAARHRANSLAMIREMVRLGYGFAAMPLATAAEDLDAGRLVQIETEDPVPPVTIYCVHVNRARKIQVRQVYQIAEQAARTWCQRNPRFATFLDACETQPASNPLET